MNKVVHGLIVVFFGIACWFLWGMLTLTLNTTQRFLPGALVPAFTGFCIGMRPLLIILPILSLAYCVYAWFRRAPARESWVGFFAANMGVLVLVMLPTIIAAWLPLISIIGRLGGK